MNKLVKMTAMIAVAATLFAGCGDDDDTTKTPAAPTIEMVGANIDDVHEITQQMSVKVAVASEVGIGRFDITIESPMLTNEFLTGVGLAAQMELVSASGSMASRLKEFGFPVGNEVKDAKTLSFDISTLVPLIAELGKKTSNHNFVLKVTDTKGQSTTKTLKFHLTGTSSVVYNNDADLWANTATLTVSLAEAAQNPVLEYRKKGETEWQQTPPLVAAQDGSYTATIAPVWESSKNAAELDIYTVKAGTGVVAAATYECRVKEGENILVQSQFTTAEGDKIPNGDMSGWSKKQMTTDGETFFPITYPNAEGDSNWDSGNNMFLENPTSQTYTPLCEEDKTESGTANLSARMVMNFVFAPGNMFTGDFVYSGLSGTVNFGKPYDWKARPAGMKVRYKAKVGTIDKLGSSDPDKDKYKDQPDRARIFVAVVDWSTQHGVTSGIGSPSGMWDPATASSLEEGAILGYGDLVITESADNWTEVTLPINWYAKDAAKPGADKFSLVISCATSMRGDYLTGCSTNVMQVDDFEWVY